jgi:AcrR family transcriptional regulator
MPPTTKLTSPDRESERPRRSALLQDRSRQTRRKLVRAALALWTERGFDRGVEETTVEEIARAAGVTKGTFYFHFAHKEDILLELGWGTAEVLYEEATDKRAAGKPAMDILDGLLVTLARRVESVPKVATARSVGEFYRANRTDENPRHFGIRRSFGVALDAAREQGLIPADADIDELALLIDVLAMDVLMSWARYDMPLLERMRDRAAFVIAGARSAGLAASPQWQRTDGQTQPPSIARDARIGGTP